MVNIKTFIVCTLEQENSMENAEIDSRNLLTHLLCSLQMQVCLVGKSRTYPPSRELSLDEQRTRYINSRRGCPLGPPGREPAPASPQAAASSAHHPGGHRALHGAAGHAPEARASELWLPGFQPREKAQRTRNCAALPRDFVDQVVLQVAHLLLGGKQLTGSSPSGTLKTWNRGGNHAPPGAAEYLLGCRQRLCSP